MITVPIAGVQHQPGAAEVVARLQLRTELRLEREPINPFDPLAVAIFWVQNFKLGYVPRTDNTPIAFALEAGRYVAAVFAGINSDGIAEVTLTWDDDVA